MKISMLSKASENESLPQIVFFFFGDGDVKENPCEVQTDNMCASKTAMRSPHLRHACKGGCTSDKNKKRAAQQRHRSALQNYMGLNSKELPSMRAAHSTSWATSLQMRSDSCYLSPVHRMSSCRICRASVAPATTVTQLVAMGPSKKWQNQPNGGMAARGVHSCDADRRDGCGETRADRRDGEKHANVMRRRTR